jgi:mRNA-degrading endonuclease RelE of RelBE toxin-antitoxin system
VKGSPVGERRAGEAGTVGAARCKPRRNDAKYLTFCTALPYNGGMVFIETSTFTKPIGRYLTDDEYLGLQGFLLKYPDAGKIVRGSGGARKLRWAISGKGKSSGIRIIYYWRKQDDEVWLLTVYGKSERETIPAHILRKIAEEIGNV